MNTKVVDHQTAMMLRDVQRMEVGGKARAVDTGHIVITRDAPADVTEWVQRLTLAFWPHAIRVEYKLTRTLRNATRGEPEQNIVAHVWSQGV